ncbi:MAG: hypothetical protein GF401_04575 [Chitinivibrionales bacterium]|nr:hypothetical protein [Chitinivibrionales bacterium]
MLVRCIAKTGRMLPRPLGIALFGGIGYLVFFFPNEEKRRTLRHLRFIYGDEWDARRITHTAHQVYVNLGKNLFDALWLSQAPNRQFFEIVHYDSFESVRRAYDNGNGVIIITAHIGCFEMLLQLFGRMGCKSFAIGQEAYDRRIDDIISNARRGENIDYMHRKENPREIIRRLNQGQVLGVLIDQDTRVEGIHAPFLGKLANTPSGPIKMAMRFNIPAFVATTARQKDGTHRVYISEPLPLQESGGKDDLLNNVTAANDIISEAIRRDPEQWVWMHRRWKRKPPEKKTGKL